MTVTNNNESSKRMTKVMYGTLVLPPNCGVSKQQSDIRKRTTLDPR